VTGHTARAWILSSSHNWPAFSRTTVVDGTIEMNTLLIELPTDGLPSPAELPDNFSDEARFLLALKLFEQGRISSGKAGRLCGMGRIEFLLAAGRDGVPVVDLTEEEIVDEFAR
jgi:Uncharacterised protein family (UPF0175)